MKLEDIYEAQERISKVIHVTPMQRSFTFSNMSGNDIFLKNENMQRTGSFKVRGAFNKICKLTQTNKPDVVVAASAGNHAQGVAYAATQNGIKSFIVMPKTAPIAKVKATENYGATVVLEGDVYDDSFKAAEKLAKEKNGVLIPAFDDDDIIAGQGTIALEILKEKPDIDIVIVPAGGGGLLAGIAFAIKQINPRIKVVGVQAEKADAIVRSFKAGKVVEAKQSNTIADGIAVRRPGDKTVELICNYVDEMVTVTEDEIAEAILLVLERSKMVVEPAGVCPLAAILSGRCDLKGQRVVAVLSGGNIDVGFIHKVVEKGLITRGRQMKFNTLMLDKPGSLQDFATIVAECGANIILVQHDRMRANLDLGEAILHVACEVSGFEHGRELIRQLEQHGYKIFVES